MACAGPRDRTVVIFAYGSGYHADGPGTAESYRTIAFAIARGSARVIADVPGVIAPVDSSFILMDVVTSCVHDTTAQLDNYSQSVRRRAPGARSVQPRGCGGLPDTTPCDDHRVRITYVSRALWAEDRVFQQTEDCEPRGDRYETQLIVRDATNRDSISLFTLGDSAQVRAAHADALRRGFDEMLRAGVNCPRPSELGPYNWGIVHRQGVWLPVIGVSDFAIYGQCQFSADIGLPLHADVVADTFPVRRVVPFTPVDFVRSPDGRVVLAVVKHGDTMALELHALTDNGRRKLWEGGWSSLNTIVMAEWSRDAAEADRWQSSLRRLSISPTR